MSLSAEVDFKKDIIKKYIPLVKYIASRVIIGKTKYIEYDDMVGYGMIGLMDALSKFNESKGMKFSTYASIRIRGSMIDEIRKNSPISKNAIDKVNRYNACVEKLQRQYMKVPTNVEIANELGVTMKDIAEIESFINYISVVSLEKLIFSDEDEIPLIYTIVDEKSPDPEDTLLEKEQKEYLANAIDLLNEKDKTVLSLYYYECLTLREIGKVLSVSESRICQLHSRAISHLKVAMTKLRYEN